MDREAAIAKLLEAEIYEHIHGAGWWLANVSWSVYELDGLIVRADRVREKIENILSQC